MRVPRTGHLATTVIARRLVRLLEQSLRWRRHARTIALLLFATWALGLLGIYNVGDLVHVLLLVGPLLLLLAFAKARDAAMRGGTGGPLDRR